MSTGSPCAEYPQSSRPSKFANPTPTKLPVRMAFRHHQHIAWLPSSSPDGHFGANRKSLGPIFAKLLAFPFSKTGTCLVYTKYMFLPYPPPRPKNEPPRKKSKKYGCLVGLELHFVVQREAPRPNIRGVTGSKSVKNGHFGRCTPDGIREKIEA